MSIMLVDAPVMAVTSPNFAEIAGEAPGIVTLDNMPGRAIVDLLRRSDHAWLRREYSRDDGTYRFRGVAAGIEHDLIGIDLSGTWDDVIVGRILPFVPVRISGGAILIITGHAISYGHAVTGGEGPYTYQVVSGGLPLGLAMDPETGFISGVASGPEGTYVWEVEVTDGRGAMASAVDRAMVISDPDFSQVVLFAHFIDSQANIINGQAFSVAGGASFDGRAAWTNGTGAFTIDNPDYIVGNAPFTLDFYTQPINAGAGDAYGRIIQFGSNNELGGLFVARESTVSPMRVIVEVGTGTGYARVATGGAVTIPDGSFTHVEVSRDGGGVWRLFIAGQKASELTYTGVGSDLARSIIRMGRNQAGAEKYNGGYDQLRLTIGVARHTENFTPPLPIAF